MTSPPGVFPLTSHGDEILFKPSFRGFLSGLKKESQACGYSQYLSSYLSLNAWSVWFLFQLWCVAFCFFQRNMEVISWQQKDSSVGWTPVKKPIPDAGPYL
jgi:hypothetical protein